MRNVEMFHVQPARPAPAWIGPARKGVDFTAIACTIITACGLAAYGFALFTVAQDLWTIAAASR